MTWTHHAIVLAFLFGLGAAVGSFLNVCIYRIPTRMSLLRPPLRCPRCASAIAPRDNVPILGWLALRGRCRSCRLPISVRYPLVEALAGVLFAAAYPAVLASAPGDLLDTGIDLAVARLLHHALLVALVITAALIGHDTGHVPRRLTITGMTLGLALGTVLPAARPEGAMARTPGDGFAVGAFGLLLGGSLVQLARLVARRTGHPEAIGGDDGALLAMIGAFLGGRVILPILLIVAVLVCLRTALAPGRLRAFRSYLGTAALILLLARPFLEPGVGVRSPPSPAGRHVPLVPQGFPGDSRPSTR